MVNKIRRLKVTVRTKEMMILAPGSDHITQITEKIDLATCPVCHAPIKALPPAEREIVSTDTNLEKELNK